ncbi:MAG TPA: GlpM family protein [Methanomicrobiales archaeon]|nr:GlpM family protein [Methanomicrobiales archaeon]
MDYLYTTLKFLIGGGLVVGVTYLAEHVSPGFGGLLNVAPITTAVAFTFTWFESASRITQDLVGASFLFAIPFLIFLASLYLLLSRLPFTSSLAVASGVWLGAALIVGRLFDLL